MKKLCFLSFPFFLILVLNLCGCGATPGHKGNTHKVVIDTTREGTPGKAGYFETISYKIDSIEIEYHCYLWNTPESVEIKAQYMDDAGTMRYIYCSYPEPYKPHGDWDVSHSWLDKYEQSILRIDSIYKGKSLASVEYVTTLEIPQQKRNYAYSITQYYKNKNVFKTKVYNNEHGVEYLEQGNDYWEMDCNVSPKYAEWDECSRSAFGKAFSEAVASFGRNIEEISPEYKDRAHKLYGVNLDRDFHKLAYE